MADTRDPLDVFEGTVIETVARERGLAVTDLRELVRRHQQSVRDLPGVDNLVYEWRKAFATDPLVERRGDSYFLAVPGHVWPEFGSALSLSTAELNALRAVHDRQLRARLGDEAGDSDAIILTRP
ncbi:hypothetical protein SAMN04487949_1351 [Halogranum gelatinilyticum]|uniref:DUF8048 domain-containing protein n=1 Tax=Halogranum gelatinilyticum TaxID=660521 RepID=A0A1G9RI54_9EURY|nr:hypothetical protein [Halogranum gelatinilyticum]SDM22873.1 hypothetical protein SAMN04487949_1351 [Halogranum gelatinilyticum]